MKTEHAQTPFEAELLAAMRQQIRSWRKEGTVSASVNCLMQCTRTPSPSLAGAPLGTNARYYYAEMFRRICADVADIAAFVNGAV